MPMEMVKICNICEIDCLDEDIESYEYIKLCLACSENNKFKTNIFLCINNLSQSEYSEKSMYDICEICETTLNDIPIHNYINYTLCIYCYIDLKKNIIKLRHNYIKKLSFDSNVIKLENEIKESISEKEILEDKLYILKNHIKELNSKLTKIYDLTNHN